MLTLKAIQQAYYNQLASLYDPGETESLFFFCLKELMNYGRAEWLLHQTDQVEDKLSKRFREVLYRLEQAEPIQYIFEKTWFMGIPLTVNKNVLIPRPETEELVTRILKDWQSKPAQSTIIDIGTGSGCIPIALKKQLPQAAIFAMDISKEALKVAKHNSQINNCLINFMLADILEWDTIFEDRQHFDVIVSNPPYVTSDEKWQMHPNVLQFEPHLALFVEGQAPLLFYETISSFALKHLKADGTLYFEINRRYGQEVRQLLIKKGFKKVEVMPDMQGADRIVSASLQG